MQTINSIKTNIAQQKPAEIIEALVKKIKYKEYLIKEEGGEAQAEEKYENIGQLINMAQKYDIRGKDNENRETNGEDLLRAFLEEVALLSDISENEK
jgi:superfamily I DNA/RNA helicase